MKKGFYFVFSGLMIIIVYCLVVVVFFPLSQVLGEKMTNNQVFTFWEYDRNEGKTTVMVCPSGHQPSFFDSPCTYLSLGFHSVSQFRNRHQSIDIYASESRKSYVQIGFENGQKLFLLPLEKAFNLNTSTISFIFVTKSLVLGRKSLSARSCKNDVCTSVLGSRVHLPSATKEHDIFEVKPEPDYAFDRKKQEIKPFRYDTFKRIFWKLSNVAADAFSPSLYLIRISNGRATIEPAINRYVIFNSSNYNDSLVEHKDDVCTVYVFVGQDWWDLRFLEFPFEKVSGGLFQSHCLYIQIQMGFAPTLNDDSLKSDAVNHNHYEANAVIISTKSNDLIKINGCNWFLNYSRTSESGSNQPCTLQSNGIGIDFQLKHLILA